MVLCHLLCKIQGRPLMTIFDVNLPTLKYPSGQKLSKGSGVGTVIGVSDPIGFLQANARFNPQLELYHQPENKK